MSSSHDMYKTLIDNLEEQRDLVIRIDELTAAGAYLGANEHQVEIAVKAYRSRLRALSRDQKSLMS